MTTTLSQRRKWYYVVLVTACAAGLLLATTPARADEADTERPAAHEWGELPPLPDTIGLGGPLAGVHGGALIVAGGANFPDAPPWADPPGKKVWHDDVYVLPAPDAAAWITGLKLPRRLAYGVSISTADGLLLIGGEEDGTPVDTVYRLKWDAEQKQLAVETLPPLPEPASYIAGGMIGNRVYVVAGLRSEGADRIDRKLFWSLDLDRLKRPATAGDGSGETAEQRTPEKPAAWESLEPWPGPPRHKAVVAVQRGGSDKKFLYMLSGSNPRFDAEGEADLARFEFLTDAYRYDPRRQSWQQIADLPVVEDARPIEGKEAFAGQRLPVAAASAIDVGQSHVLVFSGATGRYITRPLTERPLFPRDVLAYHTITDTWVPAGKMPQGVVTTAVTRWNEKIVVTSGEIKPGVRTPKIQVAEPLQPGVKFGPLNYVVLALYLAALVAMGFFFSKREKSTSDFFLAGKRIPWWAAGMSIYATQLSAITFVSTPAVAYATDWVIYPSKIMIFAMAPVVIYFYLPFFCRLNVTTAYEYLERRFNVAVRLFGSLSFITFQLIRMAVVMFLPALALAAITGIDIYVCIYIMGILSTLYTVLGGMEAVVWTDVLQVIVLWGGMALGLVLVVLDAGGVGNIYRMAAADEKLTMWNWSWSTSELATWLILLGVFALQFGPYTTDQAVIQRYLTTRDEKEAAKGIWLNGLLSIPFSFLFFALGTCLYVFYRQQPELLAVGMQNDQVFPLFVAQRLPAGLSGLVIAGIFAASMSSLDSSMHSISTAVTTDFYRRFNPKATDHRCLVLARWIIVLLGIVAIVVAAALVRWDITSLFFFFQKVLGLISSGLVGIFILGIFTKRANGAGALVGAVASTALLVYVALWTDTSFYLYAVIGITGCTVIGYLASLVLPGDRKDLAGLTLHTRGTTRAAEGGA